MEDDPFINKETFKNRRNMAWVALASIVTMPLVFIFGVKAADMTFYDALITWVFSTLTAVILGYMGSSSWTGVQSIKMKLDAKEKKLDIDSNSSDVK